MTGFPRLTLVTGLLLTSIVLARQEPEPEGSGAAATVREIVQAPPLAGTRGASETAALRWALGWLLAHQEDDGRWSSKEPRCGAEGCAGGGLAGRDVGVTGLALLALMANGRTQELDGFEPAIQRGLDWLVSKQVDDHPRFQGILRDEQYCAYGQGIATLALVRGRQWTGRADLDEPIRRAVSAVMLARNPKGAWRYHVPPIGDNDVGVTGWMLKALAAARELEPGLVDLIVLREAFEFIQELTDPKTGRVGYDMRGGPSSRIPDLNRHYPTHFAETMTAVGFHCRTLLGESPRQQPVLVQQADLMLARLPQWSGDSLDADMYYWYHGTLAMQVMGAHTSRYWTAWSAPLRKLLTDKQCKRGHERGSWDPIGPWGCVGGRVYATAINALTLEMLVTPLQRAPR